MDYDSIFEAYYNLYRAEADTPANTDDEYVTGMRFANEAVNRWANFDATYWKELYSTLVAADDGSKLIVLGQQTYECPSDMREAGGFVKILDANGSSVRNYPIVEPQEVQFKSNDAGFAYFTGNPSTGFTLNLNTAPDTSIDGLEINYIYYKKPTLFITGTDTTEVPDSYFIVHRMLANRFRVSRNPYYTAALRDSEDALRIMQMDNNSGTWSNPWKVPDRSGSSWGA